jgi:hypothetical protein
VPKIGSMWRPADRAWMPWRELSEDRGNTSPSMSPPRNAVPPLAKEKTGPAQKELYRRGDEPQPSCREGRHRSGNSEPVLREVVERDSRGPGAAVVTEPRRVGEESSQEKTAVKPLFWERELGEGLRICRGLNPAFTVVLNSLRESCPAQHFHRP